MSKRGDRISSHVRALLAVPTALLMMSAAFACGSSSSGDASGDASTSADSSTSSDAIAPLTDGGADDSGPFTTAAHRALPTIPNQGGGVLAHPNIVTVTFNDDAYADQLEAWGQWVVGSSWLAAAGADYGVGAGTYGGSVRLTDNAPSMPSLVDLQGIVTGYIESGKIPAPTTDVVYMFYFPSTTTLELDGETSCNNFSGYHYMTSSDDAGTQIAYAAVGRCATYFPGLNELENVERTASHELIEAATDPIPSTGYAIIGNARTQARAWSEAVTEGEVGDLCMGAQVDQESGNIAQRIWSSSAAAAGNDPCAPASSETYFSASAAQDWYSVAAGGSVTIPFTAWSAAPVDDWIVYSEILPVTGAGWVVHTVSDTTIDTDAGTYHSTNNGRTFTVTLTAPATAASGDQIGVEIRSRTPSDIDSADAKREATYNFTSVGLYVP